MLYYILLHADQLYFYALASYYFYLLSVQAAGRAVAPSVYHEPRTRTGIFDLAGQKPAET